MLKTTISLIKRVLYSEFEVCIHRVVLNSKLVVVWILQKNFRDQKINVTKPAKL